MKKISRFHKGMFVTIPHILTYTKQTCGISPTMYRMSGCREKIDIVHYDGKIIIKSFIWDSRDFKLPPPPKKIPIQLFDPEELVT